jgi:hypothetical protein
VWPARLVVEIIDHMAMAVPQRREESRGGKRWK